MKSLFLHKYEPGVSARKATYNLSVGIILVCELKRKSGICVCSQKLFLGGFAALSIRGLENVRGELQTCPFLLNVNPPRLGVSTFWLFPFRVSLVSPFCIRNVVTVTIQPQQDRTEMAIKNTTFCSLLSKYGFWTTVLNIRKNKWIVDLHEPSH